jgi:hypothetical protein
VAVILGAIVLAVAIAAAAGAGFYMAQEPIYRAQPGPGVRVGDPGQNLVGQDWTGEPSLNDIRKGENESVKADTKDNG